MVFISVPVLDSSARVNREMRIPGPRRVRGDSKFNMWQVQVYFDNTCLITYFHICAFDLYFLEREYVWSANVIVKHN